MLGASLLPARWRPAENEAERRNRTPSWLNRQLRPYLAACTRLATVHPIYTIVFFAILASTTYLGLLESSLFERHTALLGASGNVDFDSLLVGSKTLYTNADNGWSWSLAENGSEKLVDDVWIPLRRCAGSANMSQNVALITFVFPDSLSSTPKTAPRPASVPTPSNSTASVLPCSTGRLSAMSQDTTLAYSMPYEEARYFLTSSQEIPVSKAASQARYSDDGSQREEKKWIMKAVRSNGTFGLRRWARNAWIDFVDLLKVSGRRIICA